MVNREIKKPKKTRERERLMYFDWDRMVVVAAAAEEELGRSESNPAEAGRQELAETA